MTHNISKCGKWKIYGNPNSKFLIAGHSHLFAMYMAMNQQTSFQNVFGIITQTNFDKPQQPDSDYWDFVAESAKNKLTAISWNGNQHNIHFLIEANLKFKALGFQENKNFPAVSLTRIKELYRPTFYELELILSRFDNRNDICLLGTPAPKSKKILDKLLFQDEYFVDMGKKLGLEEKTLTTSSDELRIFMWEITQDLTEEVATKFGCKFLKTPVATYDKNKILLDKYSAPDMTHANIDFGLVMLQEIEDFFRIRNG